MKKYILSLFLSIGMYSVTQAQECFYHLVFSRGYSGDTVSLAVDNLIVFNKQWLKVDYSTGKTDFSIVLSRVNDSCYFVSKSSWIREYKVNSMFVYSDKGKNRQMTILLIVNGKKYPIVLPLEQKRYLYLEKDKENIKLIPLDEIDRDE